MSAYPSYVDVFSILLAELYVIAYFATGFNNRIIYTAMCLKMWHSESNYLLLFCFDIMGIHIYTHIIYI